MALLLALAVNVGVGTMVETFSRTFADWLDGRLGGGRLYQCLRQCAGSDDQGVAAPAAAKSRRSCRAAGPRCKSGRAGRDSGPAPITPPIGITGRCCNRAANAWTRLRPGDAGFVSEQLARRLKLAIGDRIEVPAPRRKLDARGRRHLCRLRQSERPDRRQYRRADPAFSRHPADANGAARRARQRSRR